MLVLTSGGLHYTRCPFSCPVWVWVWVWSWACVVLSAGQGVGQGATTFHDFPIAAEDNFYSFNPDGTYTFSYDTGGGEHQSFRIEMRDASGRVSGRYGYVDPAGALRITNYQADSSGYRAKVEVYHQVSLAPPAPLLVGPLPKQPTAIPDPSEGPPSPPAMRPVGPAPFFPILPPVLIIGPLPKPFQPQSNEVDEDSPDLTADSLFTIPPDPQVPALLPLSPLDNEPSRDALTSPQGVRILQGTLIDILQQSSDDFDISPNGTATDILQTSHGDFDFPENCTTTPSTMPKGNKTQHTDPRNTTSRHDSQTPTSVTLQDSPHHQHPHHQQSSDPQLLLLQNHSPIALPELMKINPTKPHTRTTAANTEPIAHTPQKNLVSDDNSDDLKRELLQPSATTITTTMSRLAQRETAKTKMPTPAITPPVKVTKHDNTRGQTRTFRNRPVVPDPPPPPLTYLPVGVSRRNYPIAPLLRLPPKDSYSYP